MKRGLIGIFTIIMLMTIVPVCASAKQNEGNSYCTDGKMEAINEIKATKSEYQHGIDRALSSVNDGMSDVEKVLVIHDWIVRECDYDENAYLNKDVDEDSYSDTGVFVNGKAVCNGYAQAFSVLMEKLGIPSYLVKSYSMNHVWNLVYVDGNWYHVDTTRDDPVVEDTTVWGYGNNDYADEGYISHKYFLLSDDEMGKAGYRGWSSDLPKANASGTFKNNCFYQKDVSFNYSDGLWYYADGNNIVCSAINGDETIVRTLSGQIMYMFIHENELYYLLAGTQNTLYSIPIEKLSDLSFDPEENQNIRTLCDEGKKVSEFSIKNDRIVVVASKDGVFERNIFSFDRLMLNGICYDIKDTGIDIGVAYNASEEDVKFRWLSYNLNTDEWRQFSDWYAGNWVTWKPEAGDYWVQVQAKTESGLTQSQTICFHVEKDYSIQYLNLNGFCYIIQDDRIDIGTAYESSDSDTKFRWLAYNLDTEEWKEISDWYAGNWISWKPDAGNYWVQVQARTGESEESYTICFCVNNDY